MIDATCTHVLFAGYSFHRKPFRIPEEPQQNYLIRLQSEGRCRALVDGQMSPVETGDLVLFAPGEPYALTIEEESYGLGEPRIESGDYHIISRGGWIESWWKLRQRPTRITIPEPESFLILFRQLVMEQRKLSGTSPEISEYYLRILCLQIDRLMSEQPAVSTKGYLAYRIKQYIEEHASQPFRLEEAAAHVDLSVSRAVHLFKEAFGTSIIKYANDVRLDMASERIIFSPLPLEQVAETCGFANYTYFHRLFRSRFGLSPKQYRTKKREQA